MVSVSPSFRDVAGTGAGGAVSLGGVGVGVVSSSEASTSLVSVGGTAVSFVDSADSRTEWALRRTASFSSSVRSD